MTVTDSGRLCLLMLCTIYIHTRYCSRQAFLQGVELERMLRAVKTKRKIVQYEYQNAKIRIFIYIETHMKTIPHAGIRIVPSFATTATHQNAEPP